MPQVSVVVPIYNVEKFLPRCLDSVLNQTFKDFEVICVNDGSPDKSLEIANEYVKKDNRVKVFTKENGGLSDARNYGLKKATGKYIYFLDSDDFIHKNLLEICTNLAEQEKSDIVFVKKHTNYRTRLIIRQALHLSTDVKPFNLNKNYDYKKINYITTNDIFSYASEKKIKDKKLYLKHCYVWQGFYSKNLIKNIPFMKGIIFEDFPWLLEVFSKKPVVTITNLNLYYYIPNLNSIMSSNNQLKKIINLQIGLKRVTEIYKRSDVFEKVKENYIYPFINYIINHYNSLKDENEILQGKSVLKELQKENLLTEYHMKKIKNF